MGTGWLRRTEAGSISAPSIAAFPTWGPRILGLGGLASCILASCMFGTDSSGRASEAASGHSLEYLVSAGPGSACRVRIDIRAWPENEARIFQAPVYYADNPVMPAPGFRAADLTVEDAAGNRLAARDTAIEGISLDGNFIVLPASARRLSYAVDLA